MSKVKDINALYQELKILVQTYCIKNGCNKKDIAAKIGIERSSFYAYLSNKSTLNIKSLFKILDAIDCEIEIKEKEPKR